MPTFPCPRCGRPVDPALSTGALGYGCTLCGWWVSPVQWFPDDWELVKKLGTGSMGEVFQARHRFTGESAALKCISDARAGHPAFVARFRQEIRILKKLVHPGVVRLVYAGIKDGQPWLALELVSGTNLREKMRAEPLSSKEAVRIAQELAEALAYVHAQSVIHGDLKPENVLLDESGRAKISDFGLSGLAGAYTTGVGPVVSGFTAAYAAPEQLKNAERSEPRADLYALGRMLFEMLTGRLPQGQESIAAARPGSGRRLDLLVTELLAPNPPARPASATEVKRRLREIATDLDRMGFTLEFQPENASVEIDGRKMPGCPIHLPELPEGKHSIQLRAPGFHDHLQETELLPGRTMKLRVALAPLACPHCGEPTSSEEAALSHEELCSKGPRAMEAASRKRSRSAVPAASSSPAAGGQPAGQVVTSAWERTVERLSELAVALLQRSQKVSLSTAINLFLLLSVIQIAPKAIARWRYGTPVTGLALAWLGLAAFAAVVDRLGRHPGRGE